MIDALAKGESLSQTRQGDTRAIARAVNDFIWDKLIGG